VTKSVPTKRKKGVHTGSNKKIKTNIIEIEEDDKENVCTAPKTRNDTEGNDKESELTLKFSELEYQE
jgi:hypothetical protein